MEKRRPKSWAVPNPVLLSALVLSIAGIRLPGTSPAEFHFALLGDRTGEAQPGVYEEAWREAATENPAFVLTVGDTIQGGSDATAGAEWRHVFQILQPYHRFPLFLTPGNHDVWDSVSQTAYEKYSRHALHYSFDWRQAHFTILDDSRTDEFTPAELEFLEKDLAAHAAQPVKFILSHRPAWLFQVVLGNAQFPLHQLAVKYGVQYVVAGHLHQMLRFKLGGVNYLSMASSGGHLRNDKAYQHGWFFEHSKVTIQGVDIRFQIEELSPPFGHGRVTAPDEWGAAGLLSRPSN